MSAIQLDPLPLPEGISEHYIDCTASGLNVHYLSAGSSSNPLLLLVHGFPELAFSWRKVMPALAGAGYHVIAFDQRGYGRTTGWDASDMSQFTISTLVRDTVVFVHGLGYRKVACVVGHDFGAVTAAWCALMRPDLFRSVVLMSHPISGLPDVPFDIASGGARPKEKKVDIQEELGKLGRKHYKYYNAGSEAAKDWDNPAQGMAEFLRGYFQMKSADWEENKPYPLQEWSASELAKLPHYYVMPADKSMPESIAGMLNSSGSDLSQSHTWLPPAALDVYNAEWTRTGFQGGLNWYRTMTDPLKVDVTLFSGKKIECPAVFISGKRDWGNNQQPGALERMGEVCLKYKGERMLDGAGHWVMQERDGEVVRELLAFLGVLGENASKEEFLDQLGRRVAAR